MPTVDFLTFVQGVAAEAVPTVVKDFGMEPPGSLKTAQLPAKFLRVPRTTRERFAFCVQGAHAHGEADMTVEVVVVFMPVVQGMPEDNFTQTCELVDHLTKTFTKADVASSWPTVSVRVVNMEIGGESYWVAVAEVSAAG